MIHFYERGGMEAYTEFFAKTFLFKSLDGSQINKLLSSVSIEEKCYQKGDIIYSPDDFERKIGFVYSGECIIGRQAGDTFIPLNTLKAEESFGIVTVFSARDEFPTLVKAKVSSNVIFFSADDIKVLVTKSPEISLNVIEFLTRKINFLNDKIAAFSGSSVEEKLAGYILGLQRKYNSLEFEFNKKKGSEAINCGRASLYRAIEALESTGDISIENKKIYIKDLEGLERVLK